MKDFELRNGRFYIPALNRAALFHPKQLVEMSERRYAVQFEPLADRLSGVRVVLLAGPSSAGKTTSARRISAALEPYGRTVRVISLDDYYKNREDCLDANGNVNYDVPEAYDISFVQSSVLRLLKEGSAEVPEFDFVSGRRRPQMHTVSLPKNGLVILEGLHALRDEYVDPFDDFGAVRVYLDAHTGFEGRGFSLEKRDVRLIRRVVRDIRFRDSTAEHTMDLWDTVCRAEDDYIRPLAPQADICVDTTHPYELGLLCRDALRAFGTVKPDSVHFAHARELCEKLMKCTPLHVAQLPSDSLMHEFVG